MGRCSYATGWSPCSRIQFLGLGRMFMFEVINLLRCASKSINRKEHYGVYIKQYTEITNDKHINIRIARYIQTRLDGNYAPVHYALAVACIITIFQPFVLVFYKKR